LFFSFVLLSFFSLLKDNFILTTARTESPTKERGSGGSATLLAAIYIISPVCAIVDGIFGQACHHLSTVPILLPRGSPQVPFRQIDLLFFLSLSSTQRLRF
ncbi:hypothetical protein BDDG_12165, partial [Blastomyces dermatitidis ATCC 18188]